MATTLAVIAGLAAWVAIRERDQAVRERDQAAEERLVASARRAASLSHATDDPATSLLLAVEAVRRDDSPDTRATLLAALSRSPALVRVIPAGGILDASAHGARLFIFGDGFRAVDTTSFDMLAADDDAFALMLAEPGRTVFANDGLVHVETSAGRLRTARTPDIRGDAWQATSDRTARRIAAGFDRESPDADRYESTVVVWDAKRPADPRVRVDVGGTAAHGGIHDFALDPDGDRLYVAVPDADEWLRAYDADNGDLLAELPAPAAWAALAREAVDPSRPGIAVAPSSGSATTDARSPPTTDPTSYSWTRRRWP